MSKFTLAGAVAASAISVMSFAGDVNLPQPSKNIGADLVQVLSERKTVRSYAETPLTQQQIADVLWCANGVSRADGKRTAPSAMNKQDIDIYCLLPDGAYLYDAANNKLIQKSKRDLRKMANADRFAPCYLVLVANASKSFTEAYGLIDVGYVSQNIYLYCQAAKLGTCAMGSITDKAGLARELGLGNSKPLLVHPVGTPK